LLVDYIESECRCALLPEFPPLLLQLEQLELQTCPLAWRIVIFVAEIEVEPQPLEIIPSMRLRDLALRRQPRIDLNQFLSQIPHEQLSFE
jgi:hypothetical protein